MKNPNVSLARLIAIPFLISVFVTMLRLTGELSHWSETWFYRPTGGITPTKTNWVIGITWLAIPFGVYFAYKLSKEMAEPVNAGKTIGLAVIGLLFLYGGFRAIPNDISFTKVLLIAWSISIIATAIQWFGWRTLFKTLLLYGLASRAVVATIMFLAMRGNWGTHYDYFNFLPEMKANLWSEYFLLAFFPQFILWVGFTIIAGSFSGGITLAIMSFQKNRALSARTAI